MKNVIVLLLLLIYVSCHGQRTFTPGFSPRANQSIVVEDGNFSALNSMFAPRYDDTTQANIYIQKDTLGCIIYTYDVHGLWVRVLWSGSKQWIRYGGYTASEGLQLNGINFEFGGVIGSPTSFGSSRVVNTNRNQVYWTNGAPVTAGGAEIFPGQPNWSPFQILTEDTLVTNTIDPPTADMPFSGLYAQRVLYYADGILKTQKVHGHTLSVVNNFKDTMTLWNQGGDYNAGVKVEREILPRGTGAQRIGVHGGGAQLSPFNSTPTLLVNTFLRNNGSNYIHTWGWVSGVNSYLVTSALDTMERYSFFQTGNFLTGTSLIKKIYGLDFQHNIPANGQVDSSWGIWDQYGYRHRFRGNTIFGHPVDSTVTDYNVKVAGSMYMRGMLQGFQGTDIASTAGVLTIQVNTTSGNYYELTGTNTITAINNTNLKNGYEVTFLFTSTATLTDGTANSGAAIGMELAGNVNFVGSADDTITLVLGEIGGTQRWREKSRSVN